MNNLQLKLSVRKSKIDKHVNYSKDRYFVIGENSDNLNHDFLIWEIEREVTSLNLRRKKIIYKVAKGLLLTSISFLVLTNPTFAATTSTNVLPSTIAPSDIVKWGMYLIGLTTLVGTILSIIYRQINAIKNKIMFNNPQEASTRQREIIKGYIEVLISPVIMFAIAYAAWILFSGCPWFVNPLLNH